MQWLKQRLSAFAMNEDAVNSILASHWDPLATVARGGFKNEYRPYAKQVARMLRDGADVDQIVRYLCRAEAEMMLLKPDPVRADRVADMILTAASTQSCRVRAVKRLPMTGRVADYLLRVKTVL